MRFGADGPGGWLAREEPPTERAVRLSKLRSWWSDLLHVPAGLRSKGKA